MNGEFLVVLPLEPIPRYTRFSRGVSIPLHATVMPWFKLESWYPAGLERLLEALVTIHPGGIELKAERREYFGPHRDVPCSVLGESEPLRELHQKILDYLAKVDAVQKSPQWVGDGYVPHISDTNGKAFLPPSVFRATELVLIERIERAEKVAIGVWSFGDNRTS